MSFLNYKDSIFIKQQNVSTASYSIFDQTNTINTNLPIVAASSGSNVLSVNRNKRLYKEKERRKKLGFTNSAGNIHYQFKTLLSSCSFNKEHLLLQCRYIKKLRSNILTNSSPVYFSIWRQAILICITALKN